MSEVDKISSDYTPEQVEAIKRDWKKKKLDDNALSLGKFLLNKTASGELTQEQVYEVLNSATELRNKNIQLSGHEYDLLKAGIDQVFALKAQLQPQITQPHGVLGLIKRVRNILKKK